MALPVYASPLERVWHYTYLAICVLVFLFLIAPILIIVPLSFNAEAYFTFTEKMLRLDPAGYSLRWYDRLLTFGMVAPDAPRDAAWWADVWNNAAWVNAAKNSLIIGVSATILATVQDRRIDVEGHTDNVPLTGELAKTFPTNWELSAARSTNVVRYLEENGVDPRRLAAVAKSMHRPVAQNNTPRGRQLNRRIEIVLTPWDGK